MSSHHKAKQSKANDQGPLQHLHSSLGPMGRVPRYRVRGRDLCCFGFVQALSGLPDVVLDDHVVPV